MASAAELEIAALFVNACLAIPLSITLIEIKHPQPQPPTKMKIKTDNNTASGFANNTIKQTNKNTKMHRDTFCLVKISSRTTPI